MPVFLNFFINIPLRAFLELFFLNSPWNFNAIYILYICLRAYVYLYFIYKKSKNEAQFLFDTDYEWLNIILNQKLKAINMNNFVTTFAE